MPKTDELILVSTYSTNYGNVSAVFLFLWHLTHNQTSGKIKAEIKSTKGCAHENVNLN